MHGVFKNPGTDQQLKLKLLTSINNSIDQYPEGRIYSFIDQLKGAYFAKQAVNEERGAFQSLLMGLQFLKDKVVLKELRPAAVSRLSDFLIKIARLNPANSNSIVKDEFMRSSS